MITEGCQCDVLDQVTIPNCLLLKIPNGTFDGEINDEGFLLPVVLVDSEGAVLWFSPKSLWGTLQSLLSSVGIGGMVMDANARRGSREAFRFIVEIGKHEPDEKERTSIVVCHHGSGNADRASFLTVA